MSVFRPCVVEKEAEGERNSLNGREPSSSEALFARSALNIKVNRVTAYLHLNCDFEIYFEAFKKFSKFFSIRDVLEH